MLKTIKNNINIELREKESTYLDKAKDLNIEVSQQDNIMTQLDLYSKEDLEKLEDVVIIIAGTRNEPYNLLVKMLLDEEFGLKFNKEDKVVLMCPPAPGIEKHASDSINILSEYDINFTVFDRDVLRSQHASSEDLKLLYAMLKPQYIIPIKGEYRQMYDHYLVAKSADYDRDNVLLLDNGEVVIFEDGILKDERLEIPVGDILIDGSNVGVVDNDVIKERSQLAEEGVIFIYCALDMRLRKVSNEISIRTKGFTHAFTNDELTTIISGLAEKIINNSFKKKSWNLESIKDSVAEETRKLIVRFTKHRPIIVPVFIEI